MRILIYGINYAPELTGIGKYTGEMAEWFVQKGYEVSVITAMPYYPEWKIHKGYKKKIWFTENINGVQVHRVPLYVPNIVDSKKRILHEFSFVLSSLPFWFKKIFQKKYDLVIHIAPPFHLSCLGLIYSKIKKTVLVNHIQDLQIDVAKELNLIQNKAFLDFLFSVEKFLLKRGSLVSTLTNGMKNKILGKGISSSRILLLPNWVDTDMMRPLKKGESLREEFGISLEDKVILYSGNLGEKQGLELVIDIADELKDVARLKFVIVGSGTGEERLKIYAKSKNLINVLFFPLQPYKKLPYLLAIADLHLILQKKSASDLVMPSKLTGILSVGGCPIVTALEGSSLYKDIQDHDFGLVCEPESKEALKIMILEVLEKDLSMKKLNARKYAEQFLNKDYILKNFINSIKGFDK